MHVTQAMGAGTMALTERLALQQVDLGASVTMRYVAREETPPPEALRALYDTRVELEQIAGGEERAIPALLRLFRSLRRSYATNEFDVVHLHSSIAGAIGRLALVGCRTRTRVYYSPHGFAFLREDGASLLRRGILSVERALSRIGHGLILTCASEHDVAKSSLRAEQTFVMRSGLPPSAFERADDGFRDQDIVVGMVGRITYQKAPWRFAEIARALEASARFVWVGSGEDADVARWIGDAPVEVTGWLSRDDLAARIKSFDILLFPTVWEGKSIALMSAQAQGIPAVVTRVVGNVDCVDDGVTGFVCDDELALRESTELLIRDAAMRESMGAAAARWARSELTDEHLGADALNIYRAGALT